MNLLALLPETVTLPDVRIKPPSETVINPIFLDFRTGLPALLNGAILIAAGIMVVLLAIGGLQYMAANGNDEATTKARRLILGSLVGFALVLGTWGIMHLVFALLGYQFG